MRKELVKEAVINLPPVNADATLLAENKLRLDGASDFTSRQDSYTFIRTPNLQGTDA